MNAKHCIEAITSKAGGSAHESWFELNGKYARVLIEWASPEEKAKILFDLEGDQVIDLYSPEEIDEFAAERHAAD